MKPVSNETKTFQVLMSGKWKPAFSGLQLPEGDFQLLTNMRYTETPGIKSVLGMSKISPLTLGFAVTPSISYTTQQMTTTGGGSTQTLTVSGGSTPYGWVIISGGGTLTIVTPGDTTAYLYTAPTTNANCANNPTIRVTEVYGGSITLKIAVNGDTGFGVAYGVVTAQIGSLPCATSCDGGSATNQTIIVNRPFLCDGTWTGTDPTMCGRCVCSSGLCGATCYVPGTSCTPCTQATIGCDPVYCDDCTLGFFKDVRTTPMLAAGCCPAKLL